MHWYSMPTLHIKLGSDGFRFFSSNKYHDIKCAFFEEKKKNKIAYEADR